MPTSFTPMALGSVVLPSAFCSPGLQWAGLPHWWQAPRKRSRGTSSSLQPWQDDEWFPASALHLEQLSGIQASCRSPGWTWQWILEAEPVLLGSEIRFQAAAPAAVLKDEQREVPQGPHTGGSPSPGLSWLLDHPAPQGGTVLTEWKILGTPPVEGELSLAPRLQ